MKAQAKIYGQFMKNIAYASRGWSGEAAYSHSLTRAFADALKRRDVDECSGQIVHYHFMWFRYLSHIWAVKDQASMHIRTVSPEPLLIALKRRDVDEGSGQIV